MEHDYDKNGATPPVDGDNAVTATPVDGDTDHPPKRTKLWSTTRFPNGTAKGPHGDDGRAWGDSFTHECCNGELWDPLAFPRANDWGVDGSCGPRW